MSYEIHNYSKKNYVSSTMCFLQCTKPCSFWRVMSKLSTPLKIEKVDIHRNATSICALSNPAETMQNPAVFEELWANSQHCWKLKKSWYSWECYLHLCSIKPCSNPAKPCSFWRVMSRLPTPLKIEKLIFTGMLPSSVLYQTLQNPSGFEELWADSQHRWKLKKLIFTEMLPLSVFFQTLPKFHKTLQCLISYEQTSNSTK